MNKSRRMAALQARAFAEIGFGVLQIDLFGCGDSDGEFREARWDIWMQDLAAAATWVENHVEAPIYLWGLRLGSLLALDFARNSEKKIDQIILWQPVISGKSFLTQFLRLRLANEMFAAGTNTAKIKGTDSMRESLEAGSAIEVAGYELAPQLAAALDNLKAVDLIVTKRPVHWFEIVSERGRSMTPAGATVAGIWQSNEVDLRVHLVPCLPFWATQEISECPELVSAMVNTVTAASS